MVLCDVKVILYVPLHMSAHNNSIYYKFSWKRDSVFLVIFRQTNLIYWHLWYFRSAWIGDRTCQLLKFFLNFVAMFRVIYGMCSALKVRVILWILLLSTNIIMSIGFYFFSGNTFQSVYFPINEIQNRYRFNPLYGDVWLTLH